jgi:hypothetical protein
VTPRSGVGNPVNVGTGDCQRDGNESLCGHAVQQTQRSLILQSQLCSWTSATPWGPAAGRLLAGRRLVRRLRLRMIEGRPERQARHH